jgi:hypothetical protein
LIFRYGVFGPIQYLAQSSQPRKTHSAKPVTLTSTGPYNDSASFSAGSVPASQPSDTTKNPLQDLVDQLQADNAKLMEQLYDASSVVLIQRDKVSFRDGYTVYLGEEVRYGKYKGATLDRIDWIERTAVLSDGRLLRMGRGLSWQPDVGPPDSSKPGSVPDRVPAPARQSGSSGSHHTTR